MNPKNVVAVTEQSVPVTDVWYNNKPGWNLGVDEQGNHVWRWEGRREVDGTPFRMHSMNHVEDEMIARLDAKYAAETPEPITGPGFSVSLAPRLGRKRHV